MALTHSITSSRLILNAAAVTDNGRNRPHNEDAFYISPAHNFALLADGMGGHLYGEEASELAIATMGALLHTNPPSKCSDFTPILQSHIAESNRAIYHANMVHQVPSFQRMGTTLVGMVLIDDQLCLFNVGDSRCYRLVNNHLVLMTEDHSLYQQWLKQGQVGPKPPKNYLSQAMGTGPSVNPDIRSIEVMTGDKLLLCSDGLSDMLTEQQITRILNDSSELSLRIQCQRLVDAANEAGGLDNITVVLVEVSEAMQS